MRMDPSALPILLLCFQSNLQLNCNTDVHNAHPALPHSPPIKSAVEL